MKKGVRILIWVLAVAAVISAVAFTLYGNKKKAAVEIEKDLVPLPFTVTASYVEEKQFSNEASFRGSIEANNLNGIFSETDGKLLQFRMQKGQSVSKGQTVGVLDRSIKTANTTINRVNYDKARLEYQRLTELLAENNASKVEVENARVQMQIYEAQLQITSKQLSQSIIQSPASGIVIEKKVNEGDYIQPGTQLATIADLNTVIARVFVPELYVVKLRRGMVVQVVADAYPETQFSAIIKTILPVANEAKAFPVEIQIVNNKPAKLLAGMSVNVLFNPVTQMPALVIPRTAITGNISSPFVFVIDSTKKPVRKAIQLGRDFGTEIEVKAGLQKGEIIITSGQANIEPGKLLKDFTINPSSK